MRKLLGTIAALLALAVMPAVNDDPHGAWYSADEERSRGKCSVSAADASGGVCTWSEAA